MNNQREVERWITVKGVHIPIFKGETVQEALAQRFKKPSHPKTEGGKRYPVPEIKSADEAYKYYKEKFTICSPVYRNYNARNLGITGSVQDKIEGIAKHFAEEWSKQHKTPVIDQKDLQIAKNQEQAKQASLQEVSSPKKVHFKKVNDINTEDLTKNRGVLYEFDKERSTSYHQVIRSDKRYVLYEDPESGYKIDTAMSLEGGTYFFRLADKDGNTIEQQRVSYNSKDAGKVIQDLLQKGEERATREAEYASGKHDVEDPYKGALGTRAKIDDPLVKIKELTEHQIINPHVDEEPVQYRVHRKPDYHNNCALCTAATIMQCKGYDVEAYKQEERTHRDAGSIFQLDYSHRDDWLLPSSKGEYDWTRGTLEHKLRAELKNAHPELGRWEIEDLVDKELKKYLVPKGSERVAKAIEDKVKSWPSGAYGELSVTWDTGSAHSIFIYNDHGEVVIFDSQDNARYSGRGTIRKVFAKGVKANATQLIRFDNLELKPGSEEVAKKMFVVRNKK